MKTTETVNPKDKLLGAAQGKGAARRGNERTMERKTTQTTLDGRDATITEDAGSYRGVALDRLDTTGPRGGRQSYWRPASKRAYQVATWSHTRRQAIT